MMQKDQPVKQETNSAQQTQTNRPNETGSVSVTGFRVVKTGGLAGVSKARNLGISYASNEFIALLDDDDLWLTSKPLAIKKI
jgi:glycosyltransferase involved in cell wall biosynthesis